MLSGNKPIVVPCRDKGVTPTEGEVFLLSCLRAAPLSGWTVYEQPYLNGDRPDFVLVNPKKGLVIIEVKDWNLRSGNYQKGNVLGSNGQWITKTSPIDQIRRYADNIKKLYSREFVTLLETFGDKSYAVIETVVYFHNASLEDANAFCGEVKNVVLLDRTKVDAIRNGKFDECGINAFIYPSSKFAKEGKLEKFCMDIETWLAPTGHTWDRRNPITLTSHQTSLAEPAPSKHRRLRGAAGSGKTLVLASRAAKLIEQGKKVLVLTYNITLQHYVRDLIMQQYNHQNSVHDLNPKRLLVVWHFHGLLHTLAEEHDVKLESPQHNKEYVLDHRWVQQCKDEIINAGCLKSDWLFDAVLVDEGQDFEPHWIQFLLHLLNQNDELLVTYDKSQNVYGRNNEWLDAGGETRGLGFYGPPAELRESHRMPEIIKWIANEFNRLHIDASAEPMRFVQGDLFTAIQHPVTWHRATEYTKVQTQEYTVAALTVLVDNLKVHPNDVAFLVSNENDGLAIVEKLKSRGYKVAHVFDESGQSSYINKRAEKWKFQPTSGTVKVCTLHSFKGWESPHIIAFLGKQKGGQRDRMELMYVALTRVKKSRSDESSTLTVINSDPDMEVVGEIFRQAQDYQRAFDIRPVTRNLSDE